MLNRKQFSRKMAEDLGITYQSAERICRDVFDYLGKTLYQDKESVLISGFGTFKHKIAKPKRIKHPATGEMMMSKERDVIKFIPSEVAIEAEDTEENEQ